MRVLWLTSVQLPAVTGDESMSGCGWLEGLRAALERHAPDIALEIVSWGGVEHAPLEKGNATYYSVSQGVPANRLRRARENWRHDFIPEAAIQQATALVRRLAPDVVHVHGTEHPLGLACLPVGRPVVASLQGIAAVCERAMLMYVPPGEILRDTLTRRFLRGDGYLHAAATMRRRAADERRLVARLTFFTGQTDWDEMVLRTLAPGAVYQRCTRVIQPPFYAAGARWPATTPTVFCVSSAAAYKGLETLLDAFRLLTERHVAEARLRVAGALQDTTIWPFLERVTRRSGLTARVDWLGRLGAQRLIAELGGAWVFVLPSHIENESNALLEAMLAGTPAVASAVGGVPEVLRHGTDGLLTQDGDPFALATALARLIQQPDAADVLAASARERARALTDPERGARDMRDVYERVVAAGPRAVPRP